MGGFTQTSLFVLLLLATVVSSCSDFHAGGMTKQELAEERNDPSICLKASVPDVCLTGVARVNCNSDACSFVQDEAMKRTCLAYASDCTPPPSDTAEEGEDDGEVRSDSCRYDSDCDPICEGDMMWKMGCNPRTGDCEKTFDTDCTSETESFGGFAFGKTCENGACVRDAVAIQALKSELQSLQKEISDQVKSLNAYRDDIKTEMLFANKECLNTLADVTNMFIIDSAMRMGSLLESGINLVSKGSSLVSMSIVNVVDDAGVSSSVVQVTADFEENAIEGIAGAATDYAGVLLDDLAALQKDAAEQKMSTTEYINFFCHYYQHLAEMESVTGEELSALTAMAKTVDQQIKALP